MTLEMVWGSRSTTAVETNSESKHFVVNHINNTLNCDLSTAKTLCNGMLYIAVDKENAENCGRFATSYVKYDGY